MKATTNATSIGWVFLIIVGCLAGCDKTETDGTDQEIVYAGDDLGAEQERLDNAKVEQERLRIEEENFAKRKRIEEEKRRLAERDRKDRGKADRLRQARLEIRERGVGKKISRLKTSKGRIYEDVVVTKVDPVCLRIRYGTGGLANIRLDELSSRLQATFGYDKAEADEFERSRLPEKVTPEPGGFGESAATQREPELPPKKPDPKSEWEKVKLRRAIASNERRVVVLKKRIASEKSLAAEEWRAFRERHRSSARNIVAQKHEKNAENLQRQLNRLQAAIRKARAKLEERESAKP